MPCDNYRVHVVDEEFVDTLDYIDQLCLGNTDVSAVILVGDMNVDLCRSNGQSKCLQTFVEQHGRKFMKDHEHANYDYTYAMESLHRYSCIDHYIVSRNWYQYTYKQ